MTGIIILSHKKKNVGGPAKDVTHIALSTEEES